MNVRLSRVKLVKPRQGWDSLDRSLWRAYAIALNRGYTDLGTYAKKAGDHGYWPAHAFDIGRKDRFFNKGWNYLKARRLAKFYVKYHKELNINYVILGRKIWSRNRPYWHSYNRDTSHDFHIHVSGVH